jgi:1,4-dihydroxy-2-naphthoate octaprenyltransferase
MRLRSVWAALCPALIGASLAIRFTTAQGIKLHYALPGFILSALTAIFLQLACNYANDYYDELRHFHDQRPREQEVLSRPSLDVGTYKRRFIYCITMGMISGACVIFFTPLSWGARIVLLGLGAICLALSWGYSGSSKPYGDKGLGDIASFSAFGLMGTLGTFYIVSEGHFPSNMPVVVMIIGKAIAIGLVVAGQLMVDNIRDIPTDPGFGKMTLAVKLGEKRARIAYHLETGLAILLGVAFMNMYLVSIAAGLFAILAWVGQLQNLHEKNYARAFNFNALMALGLTFVLAL